LSQGHIAVGQGPSVASFVTGVLEHSLVTVAKH